MSLWCFAVSLAQKTFLLLAFVITLLAFDAMSLPHSVFAQMGSAIAPALLPERLQDMRLQRIGMEQGLSSRALTSAVQDVYGFLWFGTQNGLNCYDGVTMTIMSATAGDTTTLPDNAVTHVHTDKRGRLWVATKSGLALFHRAGARFTTFLRGQSIADIFEDSRGMLWLTLRATGTKTRALCEFNPETAAVHIFEESQNGLRSAYIYDVFEDSKQRLWLGTANGLYRYDHTTSTWTAFLTDTLANRAFAGALAGAFAKAPRSHIQSIGEANGTLWIGTDGGLGRVTDINKGTVEWFATKGGVLALHTDSQNRLWAALVQAGTVANTLSFVSVSDIANGLMTTTGQASIPAVLLESKIQRHRMATDAQGTVWWGMGNGVIAFSPNNVTTRLLLADPQTPSRIKAPVVVVVVDRFSNTPFFARLNVGVESFVPLHAAAFRHYSATPDDGAATTAISLLSPSVSALYEAQDGAVWIGYRNGAGASRYDRKSGTITHFRQDPTNPASLSGAGGETSITAFLQDKQGRMWVGGYGLDRWDGAGQNFTHFQALPGQNIPVTALLEDRSGRIWVGTKFGLSVFDSPKEGNVTKIERFVNKPNDTKSLGNNSITALYEDYLGQVWVGHERGLDCYIPESKQFEHVVLDTATGALLTSAVTSLYDGSGFWVGTQSGLYAVNHATKMTQIHFTTTRTGSLLVLPDDHISAIVYDRRGNEWISTPRGLCRKWDRGYSRTYTTNDGLADVEFLDRAALSTRDGMLWFGSASGLTAFHPDSIVPNMRPPVVVLTELYKFGVPAALEKSLAELASEHGAPEFHDALELGYGDKVISFHYAALDFAGDAAKAHYAYKLEGFDTDWLYAGSLREAKYTSLPAGTYTFCVQATNSDGVFGNIVKLRVVVSPPWWRTWWFLALASVAGLGVLWSAYKWRVRSIERRSAELEQLVDERTHLLQDANVEVGRQLEILNEQAKEIEITNSRLQETNLELDHTVTELKDTQAQLVQSERLNAVGMLTAGVMHEINNPNSSVFSALELVEQRLSGLQERFLSMLDERDRTTQEAMSFVTMITRAQEILLVALNGSERIKNIVLALQGFTKHQHDGMTKSSIAGEIHTTVTMFQYQFKDVEVEESIPPDWRIEGSWAELNQAMLNLLVNAAQAGATKVTIIADPVRNGSIRLRITDNGEGMSGETLPRIFEPFYTTKSVGNSGLGLSITKKIIEQHGGSIAVESRAEEGTTFTITLPAH
jgi:signal transduction histidine kinase/ligand-binding sensor domain-containing protein